MEMANLYTKQKGKNSTSGILWYSVAQWIQHSSRRRLFWSDDYDVTNTDAMGRIRFDELMSTVHLVDNMKITADPFFKMHPLFQHLNDINNTILTAEHVAVDEMMTEYSGRHGCRQFSRGKPVHFGYKI